MHGFSGKPVLITGATGALGGAVTRSFVAADARVAAVARDWRSKDLVDTQILRIEADLTTEGGARRAVEQVAEQLGPVHVLVHLVGGFAGGLSFTETGDDIWEKMMNLNLRSAIHTMRAALPVMIRAKFGRVVVAGSRAGVAPAANMSAYCAAKAALHALVQCVAEEVKADGVTVNAVLPSVIDSPGTRAAMPKADFTKWAKPESIASAILWLASEEAADTTGALVPVYGRL